MRWFVATLFVGLASCGVHNGDPGDSPDAAGTQDDASVRDVGHDAALPDAGDAGEEAGIPGQLTLDVLSGRADMVTGGTVLVSVQGGGETLEFSVDGEAMTAVSGASSTRPGVIARVEGLPLGDVALHVSDGHNSATIDLTVYPITGPVFSGPHEDPYFCTTSDHLLGAPLDEDCSVATQVIYARKTVAGEFELLADPAAPPADTAIATTYGDEVEVPFVLKIEVGTINRAIYWIATLFDPEGDGEPWNPSKTWNGKMVYNFGGGCGTGYTQGDPALATAFNDLVGLGFAWVHASLNTLGNNCNDVLSAETMMMVKEHFTKHYGVPTYTIGFGGSGGAIQQHMIADNYPGLLDGLLPMASYPDIWSIFPDILDCRLLYDYFDANPTRWPDEASRTAVTGFAADQTCAGWIALLGDVADPSSGCLSSVPADAVYDAVDNPTGARCTVQDHMVNVFGRDPATGFARRAWSNVGVQYGLEALQSGAITLDDFIHLNASIGSYDIDGQPVTEREPGDPEAVATAYRTGRVLDAGRLVDLPVIDVRNNNDTVGDFHDAIRTLSTRDRIAAHGHADNHISFTAPPNDAGVWQAVLEALLYLDLWVTAAAQDEDADRAAAVSRARPDELGDRCYVGTAWTPGTCSSYPSHETPRSVAGAGRARDVIQCALRPLDPNDYPDTASPGHLALLEAIFPDGVCDWDAPPPHREPYAGPWQRF